MKSIGRAIYIFAFYTAIDCYSSASTSFFVLFSSLGFGGSILRNHDCAQSTVVPTAPYSLIRPWPSTFQMRP